MSADILVLNAGYEPLHYVNVQHAMRMLVRGVAVIEEAHEARRFGPYPLPRVLRLVRYVVLAFKNKIPRWSKSRLLTRDEHTCAYCGDGASTVDHILPSSRGGASTWLNTVAACKPCNTRKGSRTPQEAGMRVRISPYEPTWWTVGRAGTAREALNTRT